LLRASGSPNASRTGQPSSRAANGSARVAPRWWTQPRLVLPTNPGNLTAGMQAGVRLMLELNRNSTSSSSSRTMSVGRAGSIACWFWRDGT